MKFCSFFLTLLMFINNGSFFQESHSPLSANNINPLIVDRYYFEKPYKSFIHSFVFSVKAIRNHSPLKLIVSKEIVDLDYGFGVIAFNKNGEMLVEKNERVKSGIEGGTIEYIFYVPETEEFKGLIEFKFYVRSGFTTNNTHYYASFKLYFPYYEVLKNQTSLKVPWEANVYPNEGYVDVKSEYFEIKGLSQNLILPSFSSLDFNELTFSIYCHIYQRSYLKRVNASLTVLNKEILVDEKGNKIPFIYATKDIPLKVHPIDESSSITLSIEETYFIDKDTLIASKERSENSFESNEIYFPQGYIDYFQNIELGIKIEAGCLTQTIFIYPFKLNFIKDYEVKNYKIVGEISGEIEDDDLEEVNLTWAWFQFYFHF